MRIEEFVVLSTQPPSAKITHGEQSLTFSISVFGRKAFQGGYDVFEHLNQYWSELPALTQDLLFQTYTNIDRATELYMNRTDLVQYLTDQVTQLLAIHDISVMRDWITFRSNIIIPEGFESEYQYSVDLNTSREKTYTRADYIELVALSMSLRCMVPVWGQHVANIRKDAGTLFKEFHSLQLLSKSTIIHSDAMEKLKVYIENISGQGKFDSNNTLKGISSEDFGYWLLSLVCVRKLCVGDVRGVEPRSNLVTSIYKFIMQKVMSNDNNFENVVKEKKFEDSNRADSENKISTLERYKIKTNISPGDIVGLEYSIRDHREIAHRLAIDIDDVMLERSIETAHRLSQHRLMEPQINLLRWIFKPVISPRGLMYLPSTTIIRLLGVLEAVLWARGYRYLALLATSYMYVADHEMMISPVDSKMRVPKELAEQLAAVYPCNHVTSGKKNEDPTTNLVARSIDAMTNQLMMYSWRMTAHEDMIQTVFGSTSRRLPVKPDIKIELSKLVLEIGTRTGL